MKNLFINSLFVLSTFISFSSCKKTEGALYSGEPNEVSFLSASTNLNMTDGTLSIPVGRTSTSGDLSIPLTLTATGTGYTNVFKLDGPVLFSNGEGKSYAKVKYSDFSIINPSTLSVARVGTDVNVGLAFPFTLNIEADKASPSKIIKSNILASKSLSFSSLGVANIDSKGGWAEDDITANVHKAADANVYKVVTPYGPFSFAFMIQSDGKTITCPNQVIANDPTYGLVSITDVTGTHVDGVVTLKVKSYQVSAGSFGSGVEIITLP